MTLADVLSSKKIKEESFLIRSTCLIGGIVYPLWGGVYQRILIECDDTILRRLPLAGLAAFLFGLTFIRIKRETLFAFLYAAMMIMTLHLVWIACLNDFHPYYQIGILVLISVTLPFYQSLSGMLSYVGVSSLAFLCLLYFVPFKDLMFFYLAVSTLFLVTTYALLTRLALIDQLRSSRALFADSADKIASVNRDIGSIMQSIRLGIFTIESADGTIGEQHSLCLAEILGQQLSPASSGSAFLGDTDLAEDQQLLIRTVLKQSNLTDSDIERIEQVIQAVMSKDVATFEINRGSLPSELTLAREGRSVFVEIDWNPIFDQQSKVEKVLVTLQDVTEKRKLREEAYQANERIEVLQVKSKLKDEKEARNVMVSKAAHHLNNPIHALVGLCESNSCEVMAIHSRLELMFPPVSERDLDTQRTIDTFRKHFQIIGENSGMIAKSLKRASTIASELLIVSGVHGLNVNKVSIGEIWTSLTSEIKEDELLGSRPMIIDALSAASARHKTWLELVSFTRSIFYVLKEAIEGIPFDAIVQLSAHLQFPYGDEVLLEIRVSSTAGFNVKGADQRRELKFCQHLLERYGATVAVIASKQLLVIEVGLPAKEAVLSDPILLESA